MDRYNFRFSATSEFTEKFQRLAEVLGVTSPQRHLEEIYGQALEIALEKKDPKRKLERRRKREAKREGGTAEKPRAREVREAPSKSNCGKGQVVSRAPSSEIRERVLERAGYQCEFRGPDGSRCTSRTGLQVNPVFSSGCRREAA